MFFSPYKSMGGHKYPWIVDSTFGIVGASALNLGGGRTQRSCPSQFLGIKSIDIGIHF